MPVGLAANVAQSPAGYSVMSRKRLNEELSEIQRKFLKIFHAVGKVYILRQKGITSSVVLMIMMHLFWGVGGGFSFSKEVYNYKKNCFK